HFKLRRDRATRTLSYLSDVTLNGNANAKGWKPAAPIPPARIPAKAATSPGVNHPSTRTLLQELGPDKFSKWILDEKRLLITDTSMRDAHPSAIATRMRTVDMLRIAHTYASRVPQLFSLEMWRGATSHTSTRSPCECRSDR